MPRVGSRLYATMVAGLVLSASACGSSGHPANSASAVASCVIAPTTTTSSTVPGLTGPAPVLVGGAANLVPTTVVQPNCLPAGQVTHALQIAEAIKASGLGCDTADLTSEATSKLGVSGMPGLPKVDYVDCEIGDDQVTITLFADHSALMSTLPMIRQAVCFVNATHPGNLTYAQGDNWLVFPQQDMTADRLATNLHASVQTVNCHGTQPTP